METKAIKSTDLVDADDSTTEPLSTLFTLGTSTKEMIVLKELLGHEREKSELRQLGGLMMVLGIGTAFSTFSLLSSTIEGMAGSEQVEGYNLPILVGNLLQMVCGMTAAVTGMICLLMAPRSGKFHTWAKWAVAIINLGPITFVISMVRLIQGADDPPEVNSFIPSSFNPSQADIRCCAAMGALVLFSVCASLVGGLTVLGLHVCAIVGQQPHSRHRAYHVIRLAYYSFLVVVGGFSQLVLGLHAWQRFGFGPYDEPIHVATYTIHVPLVSVIVGSIQIAFGMMGICRSNLSPNAKSDTSFLTITCLSWVVSTYLQFLFQPAYSSDSIFNSEAATVSCVYLGFFVMPAFLDHLVRTTPIQPRPQYYGLPPDAYYKEDLPTSWLRMVPPYPSQEPRSEVTKSIP